MSARILVVQLDATRRQALQHALEVEPAGYRVVSASGLGEAQKRLRYEAWDLVLCDLNVDGGTGLDVLAQVRADTPDSVFVLVAAAASTEQVVDVMRAGAWDALIGPVDDDRLAACVVRALRQRHLLQATNLYKATESAFSSLDAGSLGRMVVRAAQQALAARLAVAYLGQRESFEVLRRTEHGGPPDPAAAAALDEIADRVASRFVAERVPDLQGFSVLGHPLTSRGNFHGVLAVARPADDPYGERDLQRLGVVASNAALALDNGRLVADLRGRVDQVARARRRLTSTERLEAIGRLATGVAYELESPIAYLRTNLRGLAEELGHLSEAEPAVVRARERLAYALHGSQRISQIADDLGRLSRTREDVEFDLRQVIEAAQRLSGNRIRARLELQLEDATLNGNPGQLAQAVIALLENADAALTGHPMPTIRVEAAIHDGFVHIDVCDQGPGMSAEVLARATEPFFTTREDAAGLGLSTAVEAIEEQGGEVRIDSTPGVGTTVRIVLPCRPTEALIALDDGGTPAH